MSESDINRTNKMVNTFIDVSNDMVTKWGSAQIQENGPQVLDWALRKVKEKILSVIEKEPEQQYIALPSMETFLKGIECGEWRKEMAMIYGLKSAGLAEEQIQQILALAQQAWEPKEPDGDGIS